MLCIPIAVCLYLLGTFKETEEPHRYSDEELIALYAKGKRTYHDPMRNTGVEIATILYDNSERMLPLLAAKFREKAGDLEYQSWIAGSFSRSFYRGDKTLILDDLRELLPTLAKESGKDAGSLIYRGLHVLAAYGESSDLAIIDQFTEHEVASVRRGAKQCREVFHKRVADALLAEQKRNDLFKAWFWTGGVSACFPLAAGIGAYVLRRRRSVAAA